MPQTYRCDLCQATTADFMITDINSGDVVAVGVECLLDWSLPIAQSYQDAMESAAAELAANAPTDGMPAGSPTGPAAEAPDGPSEAPEAADDEWEGDYPQPAPAGRRGGQGGRKSDGGEETSPGPAADVQG